MGRVVVLAGVVATLTACGFGNWSNDDLVFERAIPRKEDIILRVPGAEALEAGTSALTQALDACANSATREQSITCQTRDIATFLNRFTRTLLDHVAFITRQRPSRKETGVRVWGPYFIQQQGASVRFEMRRDDAVGQGGFRYCLHKAAGDKSGIFPRKDEGVKCGTDAQGFVEVFSGTYVPSPDGDASDVHNAMGTMRLDISRQRDAGLNEPTDPLAQGVFEFVYDSTAGAQTVTIHIEGVNQSTGVPGSAEYAYHRAADGKGRMDLEVLGGELRDVDRLVLAARWNAQGAARVDATATVISPATTAQGWECTNGSHEVVSRHYAWDTSRDLPVTGGDPSLCPDGLPDP